MVGSSATIRRQRGFTYLAVILILAMMGAGLAATGQVWRTVQQREKEKELLFIGNEYRKAIGRYLENGPGGIRDFPRQLDDLLLDRRHPTVQRYLRRPYRDPMTNSMDWGLVQGPEGGIAGVYSKSKQKPLKVAGFAYRDTRLENAAKYSDWIFIYESRSTTPLPPRGTPEPGSGGPSSSSAPMGELR